MSDDFRPAEGDREASLPKYEKTESVPFTLNLQEDLRHPGQFQLVVNIPQHYQSVNGISLGRATSNDGLSSTKDSPKPPPSAPVLYQTQQSSPSSSPIQDKQGWSDLDAVHPEFLRKVVPDWNVTFSRSDSTASTQSKKLADIKARIKKKGKGYVVRLLKGSTADPNDVAEVDLGQQETAADSTASHELDSSHLRVELDSTQVDIPSMSDSSLESQNVHEIGTSNEPGVQRWQARMTSSGLPVGVFSRSQGAGNRVSIVSTAEEGLSEAETLIPDIRSISGQLEEDQSDAESTFTNRSTYPTRTHSTSSIVKTPTRGLSVVGPVRRVGKSNHVRVKSGTTSSELKRTDARKSVKRRSSRNSTSIFATGASLGEADLSTLWELGRPVSGLSREQKSSPNEFSTRQLAARDGKSVKPRRSRRSSVDDLHVPSGSKAKLQLQTNVPRPKSTNATPVTARNKPLSTHRPVSSSSSSVTSTDNTEEQHPSLGWSEVDPSDELREALGKVLKSTADETNLEESHHGQSIPRIVQPDYEGPVGQIPLPSEIEIRSIPVSLKSPTIKFWGLALNALSEKIHEGFKMLRDMYGAEPPVRPGQVRVRWTCVSRILFS